jgi:hypothetical protein
MDITADTLVNQVAALFLAKVDKQNIDPSFLQKFLDGLLGKLNYKDTRAIKQQQSDSKKVPSKSVSLADDIKNAYKSLLKDSSYKNDYKKFLIDVLPKGLVEEGNQKTLDVKDIESTTLKPETKTESTNVEKKEGRPQLIEKPQEKQKVIFDGFSERGWAFFSERLPKILKNIIPKPGDQQQQGGGIGLLGGGIALLLGGLAALVTGLMTDGPFKGLLKILSKAGLQGGIKMLEVTAKAFIGSLKQVIMAPINLLDDAVKLIGKVFGKGAYKAVLTPIRAMKGLFTKMLGSLVQFITPLLKKLPLIGTVISWGFAYSRFKSGDVVGGTIDVLSGIASIFPGVGTAIAVGLDVLNAFLDYKGDGANEKTTQKKTGLLKEWTLGLGKTLYNGIKYIPVIGPLIQAVEDMANGKWLDATYNLVRATPGLGVVLDIINYFTESKTKESIKGGLSQTGDKIGEWLSWVRENIWEKITGFVTGVFDGVKDWWNNLSWDPKTWVGITPESPNQPATSNPAQTSKQSTPQELTKTSTSQPVMLAEGGIVTQPVNAVVGEAGPEAVLPLEKYFNPQNLSLNNTTLEEIANNTSDTNSSLKVLSDALFKLIVVLDKKTSQTGATVINNVGKTAQQNTPASVIANTNADPIRRVRMQFA